MMNDHDLQQMARRLRAAEPDQLAHWEALLHLRQEAATPATGRTWPAELIAWLSGARDVTRERILERILAWATSPLPAPAFADADPGSSPFRLTIKLGEDDQAPSFQCEFLHDLNLLVAETKDPLLAGHELVVGYASGQGQASGRFGAEPEPGGCYVCRIPWPAGAPQWEPSGPDVRFCLLS